MSILDVGLENGNAKLVRTAIEHGAVIDNPERYEHMAYVETSMEEYLKNIPMGRLGKVEEIAERLNVSLEDVRSANLYSYTFLSIDSEIEEIPIDKLSIIIDKMGLIIEESKERRTIIFNKDGICRYIEYTTKPIKKVKPKVDKRNKVRKRL